MNYKGGEQALGVSNGTHRASEVGNIKSTSEKRQSYRTNFEFKILQVLCILMPLHQYVCVLLLKNTQIDNLWRDALILIAVLCIFLKKGLSCRFDKNGFLIASLVIVFACFAAVSYLTAGYPATFNVVRTYTVPMLVYFIVINSNADSRQWHKLINIIIIEFAIEGYYCFIQAFLLGTPFALRLGYGDSAGRLDSSFYISGFYGNLRAFGTFAYPNTCGSLLALFLSYYLLSDFKLHDSTPKQVFIVLGMAIGLLATFSRSSIFGLLISLFVCELFKKKEKRRIIQSSSLLKVILVVFVAIIGVLIANYITGGLLGSMVGDFARRTLSGNDSSASKHAQDIFKPLTLVLQNPIGLGFGNNGSMALEYSSSANLVESSFWLMCYEVGPLFALAYFVPYFRVILSRRSYGPKLIGFTAGIITLICTFFVLPNVQSFEVIFYAYLFIGLYWKTRNYE